MTQDWLESAKKAIHADAALAYFMCQETAEKQKVNLWFVVEEFKREFERLNQNKGRKKHD